MLNSVRDKKKTFFGPQKSHLLKTQKSHFTKGLTHAFHQRT